MNKEGKFGSLKKLNSISAEIKKELHQGRENKHEKKLELVSAVEEQLQKLKELNGHITVDKVKIAKLFKVIKEAKDEHSVRVVSRNIHVSDLKEKIKFISENRDKLILMQMESM